MMMFSALKNNDKVGLVTFCDDVLDYYPARKGKGNVLHLIRELIGIEPVARPTSLAAALEFLTRVQKRRAVVFLFSDFQAPAARQSLALCNSRHDLIAVSVTDPREQALPDVGFISLLDAETGRVVEVDTRHRQVRELFARRPRNGPRGSRTIAEGWAWTSWLSAPTRTTSRVSGGFSTCGSGGSDEFYRRFQFSVLFSSVRRSCVLLVAMLVASSPAAGGKRRRRPKRPSRSPKWRRAGSSGDR